MKQFMARVLMTFGLAAAPQAAHADLIVEHYLTNAPLADAISEARDKAYDMEIRGGKLVIPDRHRCALPNLPKTDWLLLASDNEDDHVTFYERLGAHLQLGEAFDPLNDYHFAVFTAKTAPDVFKTYFNKEGAEFKKIADRLINATMAQRNTKTEDFYPPELHDLDYRSLVRIWSSTNDDFGIRQSINDILEPRARLLLQILTDVDEVCSADTAKHQAASARVRRYFSAQPLGGTKP